MSPSPAWTSSLSAVDRYEAIRSIQASRPAADAVALERRAYEDSASRDEYNAACSRAAGSNNQSASQNAVPQSPPSPLGSIRIGPYNDCVFVAEGVTSRVYRSGDYALKVIVAHAPLEPHSPQREVKILQRLHPPCIPLLDVFRDQEQRLVLKFPLMPMTLAGLLAAGQPSSTQLRAIFTDTLRALEAIHADGIVHRDLKPSAILLASPAGPAFLSDFGTAWHPSLSPPSEPANAKILDIGTGAYRAPEVLFAHRGYGPPVDMWGMGVMLAEALRSPPCPPFESRSVDEDGNQLGLILSIFKTLGTPTPETWPEARDFVVSPFELWTVFPPRSWPEILPDVDALFRDLVAALVRYDGHRASATEVSRRLSASNV
ncbi:hypothetical protein L249_3860 [Ophiocordyceps polyrhachis-furcata BCC 54312]|uniref:cyclin-dependent kinase n=1 Tax=Ophiocordyceps polyrhachis-furcata BCC 54312 TaxID=1330021 RepID=A0A367L630_9HYPO|nr:hypothetical protein L249_3860 [Ophiocordyceps polyrhachis-furcata BCC 54312]